MPEKIIAVISSKGFLIGFGVGVMKILLAIRNGDFLWRIAITDIIGASVFGYTTFEWASSSYVLSDLSAAFLYAQLQNIDNIQVRRMALYSIYLKKLSVLDQRGLAKIPKIPQYNEHNGHIFYLITESMSVRSRLIEFLKEKGIMAVFHYVPLHTSPMGQEFGYKKGMLPVTENLSERLVRLPLCSAFDEDIAEIVSDAVLEFYGVQ